MKSVLPASMAEIGVIIREFGRIIISCIENRRPVYLDGLGILLPVLNKGHVQRIHEGRLLLREENWLSIGFEKCDDLTLSVETFKNIAETKDLVPLVYARLPLDLALAHNERDIRKLITEWLREFRQEIIVRGFSRGLKEVGTFYALHNRQGSGKKDWFAGADIFLSSDFRSPLKAGDLRSFLRPEFRSAWEPFTAAYGTPLKVFTLEAEQEILRAGIALPPGNAPESGGKIRVAVYSNLFSAKPTLIFCTDGLRNLGLRAGARAPRGNEFVMQIPLPQTPLLTAEEIPEWVGLPLSLGWLLLLSRPHCAAVPGLAFSADTPIAADRETLLGAVCTVPFSGMSGEQLSAEGPFSYLTLCGITADELALARRAGAAHLLTLLRQKGHDQCTNTARPSLLTKSSFALEEPAGAGENQAALHAAQEPHGKAAVAETTI